MNPPSTSTLKIGLSARLLHPRAGGKGLESKTLQVLEPSVAQWVLSRNVIALMIPMVTGEGELHRSDVRLADYAQALDGLVLQGGADLDPRSYGEDPIRPEWTGDAIRDAYELELLQAFLDARKPVLGICRGMQLINVAFGGSLYQDIPSQLGGAVPHEDPAYAENAHEVSIVPDGRLARHLQGARSGHVVSIHHQAVKKLGRGLCVEAHAPGDRLIEALSADEYPFVVGVQWHPEFHYMHRQPLLDCDPLLDAFLEAARRTQASPADSSATATGSADARATAMSSAGGSGLVA